jgi:hypothetical protein
MKKPIRTIDLSKVSKSFLEVNPHLSGIVTGVDVETGRPVHIAENGMLRVAPAKPTGVRRDKPDEEKMNKTEYNFFRWQLRMIDRSMIEPWPLRLRWGGSMHYTPDFGLYTDEKPRLIEVKGAHIRSRDIVRFKGCKAEWSWLFDFEMWQYFQSQWKQIL